MKTIFKQLYKATVKEVEHYKTDFSHDQKSIKENPGKQFLHITRKTGTHLAMFFNSEDYPKAGERVKYLFGTANREELLQGNFETLQYYIKNDPISAHYYNGQKLKRIKIDEAAGIYEMYLKAMKNTWREEEDAKINQFKQEERERAQYFKEKYNII